MKIVFMGTPDFAVGILDAIVQEGRHNICAIVTSVDKPAGRGMKIQKSAVKLYAEEHNLPILQPKKLRDEHFISQLKQFQADLFVVVAFRMLPRVVWNIPPKGTINLHASLLPQYRGAAPINWAIINGEKETGVTTFFINEIIDSGNIILKAKTSIEDNETAETLHDKLLSLGKNTICQTLQLIEQDNVKVTIQDNISTEFALAPKIFKQDCKIDWNKKAIDIYNFIRGLSPYPAAFTSYFNNKGEQITMKIFNAQIGKKTAQQAIGEISSDDKTYLTIACLDGCIYIKELQIFGKKRMTIDEFLLGNKGFNGKIAQ